VLETHHAARTATSTGKAVSNAPASPGAAAGPAVRFMLGEWLVDLPAQALQRDDERVTIEPRQMAVLAALCRHPGDVMSADTLLDLCWAGQSVGDNPVHKAIASLRRALGDSATAPRYIETVRKQGYRLVATARVVSADNHRRHEGSWRGGSPFRGLEAFDATHASVFFGRDDSVTLLRACLAEQWRRGHALVLLLGASGSGKTSLVQAGLLPAMLAAPIAHAGVVAGPSSLHACTSATVDLGAHDETGAWGALAGGLLDWEIDGVPLLPGYSIATLATDLRNDPGRVMATLRLALQACARPAFAAEAPPLLVLDRLEALFQAPLADDAAAFSAVLEPFATSGLVIVLAVCRNDFYSNIAAHRLFMQGKPFGSHVDLGPPDAEALAQIVRLPARVAGLSYSTDPTGLHRLDDRLCADAMRAPDALPLLQYTLQSLYLARAAGDLLTWEAYDALEGLEGAIGQRAEAVLAALPPNQQQALMSVLPRLVGWTAGEAMSTSRWMRESELADADEAALVHALVDARLLVADRVGGAAGVRIAHEALLRRWPRVTSWIAQHRSMLAVRDELLPWVRRWNDGARAQALLLPRGLALWRVGEAVVQAPDLFSAEERDYVGRSQRRMRRQAWLRGAAAVAIALLAVAAGVMAYRNAQLARIARERELQSQRLATFMLGDLAEQLRPLGKIGLLASIGEQGEQLLGHGAGSAESPRDALQRAKALVVIGEAQSSRGAGHTEIAVAALREAHRLLEPLQAMTSPQAPKDTRLPVDEYYKTLGASAFWLGQIAIDQGNLADAALQMGRYQAACERWRAAAPSDGQAVLELGYAYGSVGLVAFRRGDWAPASQGFESSLELKLLSLAAAPNDADRIYAVANGRVWLGELAYIRGDARAALALYDSAFAMEDGLRIAHPDQIQRLRDAGIVQLRRAEALQALARSDDALIAMRQASMMLEKAAGADPRNRWWRSERLGVEGTLLLALLDAGLPSEASRATLDAHLAEADPPLRATYQWQIGKVRVAAAGALTSFLHGDLAASRAAIDAANAELDVLLARRPHDWRGYELRARLVDLDIRVDSAAAPRPPDTARCRRHVAGLQPAVDSGQRGPVLETWLRARQCAGDRIEAAWFQKLAAGGYVPRSLKIPSTTQR
jgi:DNA-binding winged helix-turn-helix (wHTH) protein/tetratricopeptide (TPR) repeat protein